MNDLTALPESFAAGTTVKYSRTYPDFPGPGWLLHLYLVGNAPGLSLYDTEATWNTSTQAHDFAIDETATGALIAGEYRWVERIEKVAPPAEFYDLDAGYLTITPDPATATAGDLRTPDEVELQTIIDWRAGRQTADVQRYQIDGTAVDKVPLDQVYARERVLRRRIARAKGAPTLTPIPISLTRL